MDSSPTTAASLSRSTSPKSSKGVSADRLSAEVRSLGYSLADLLLKFIAFKGKTDAICAQKLRDRPTSPLVSKSRVSIPTFSDLSNADGSPSDTHLHKVLSHSEEICDKLFDIFDAFFAEYHSLIDGSIPADWSSKGRENSLRVAQAVVDFTRRKDDRRFKILSFIFVLLLGCLMATIMWNRFARPQTTQGTQTDQ